MEDIKEDSIYEGFEFRKESITMQSTRTRVPRAGDFRVTPIIKNMEIWLKQALYEK